MADILMHRGGTADFKGYMCNNQWPEFLPPYDSPHYEDTPPFNSHACGSREQGWLQLDFPLVPNLADTYAHRWMQSALKGLTVVNDTIWLNWVPSRAFVSGLFIEVTRTDANLDGVYVMPVAGRVVYDYTTREFTGPTIITEFNDELTAAGVTQMPLGTAASGDKMFAFARLSIDPTVRPSTFGISLSRPAETMTQFQLEAYTNDPSYGHVLLGLRVVQGDAEKIAAIWRSNVAVYCSAMLQAFECKSQTG